MNTVVVKVQVERGELDKLIQDLSKLKDVAHILFVFSRTFSISYNY